MKVGDSSRSAPSNPSRSEEKREVRRESPVVQEKKTQPALRDSPKLPGRIDSFERATSQLKTGGAQASRVSAFKAAVISDKALLLSSALKAANALGAGSNVRAVNTTVSGSASSGTASTTATDAASILEMGRESPTEAAEALAQRLMDPNLSQAEKEALVIAIIEQDPSMAAQILDVAGGGVVPPAEPLSAQESQAIATTVGQAWEHSNPSGQAPAMAGTAGTLDAGDLRALLSPRNMNAMGDNFGALPHTLGNVFAASGSSSLQTTAATQMYDIGAEIAAGHEVDGFTDSVNPDIFATSYMAGSALAASGSPEAAQALMSHVANLGANAVSAFVTRLTPAALDPDTCNALGKLMQAVGGLPATPAADLFFDQAVAVARADGGSGQDNGVAELQKGLAQYFQTNMEHTTTRWASSGQIPDRTAYAHFAANVLFGDSFEGQEELRSAFATHLGQRAGALQGAAPGDPAMEEQARQLGFLIGGAEVGFQRALGFVQDRNKAREGMVDFVFGIAQAAANTATGGAIPNFSFGPINVQGTVTDALKEQVYKWVREEEPDANEMTRPLYETGLSIPNDYQDEMQAIRGTFATDEANGYLD